MAAAYPRSFENTHLYFHTGHVCRRISGCAGKHRIVLADVHGGKAITDQSEAVIGEASSESEARVSSIGSGEQPASRGDHAKTSDRVGQSFHLDYGDDRIERAIDERVIDRLGLFDRSDDGSGRYDISLDLENEDGDWSFEVTVTMEF